MFIMSQKADDVAITAANINIRNCFKNRLMNRFKLLPTFKGNKMFHKNPS